MERGSGVEREEGEGGKEGEGERRERWKGGRVECMYIIRGRSQ